MKRFLCALFLVAIPLAHAAGDGTKEAKVTRLLSKELTDSPGKEGG